MYKTFIDIVKFCTSWCNQNWLVLVAFIIVDLMVFGAFVFTVRGRVFKTERTIDYYNNTIKQNGLKTRESFQNLDKTIKQNKTVITEVWTAVYPDNICFFTQSVSYSIIAGQMGRSRTRRNFIFGLAIFFAAFSVMIILNTLSTVGYLAFALPIIVLAFAFFTEAVFVFIDDIITKRFVRSYNEFFTLVSGGIRDVYGIKVCQCQCVAENFDFSKAKVGKAALSVRQDEVRQITAQDNVVVIKEKPATAKSENVVSMKKPKASKIKIKEQKEIKVQTQKQAANVLPMNSKNKPQKAVQKQETIKRQMAKQKTKESVVLAKQQNQRIVSAANKNTAAMKQNNIQLTKTVAKKEKINTTKHAIKTDKAKTAGTAMKTVSAAKKPDEKVKVALFMTDTQKASLPEETSQSKTIDSGRIQVIDSNKTQISQVSAVTEGTSKQLSTDAKLESLSQRLSAIREVTSTVTTETTSQSETVSGIKTFARTQAQVQIPNAKALSDVSVDKAVKGERSVAKKVEKRGKYDEREVMSALDGLLKSMNAFHNTNENDTL